ncbi:hypothetical protein RF11_04852 [Thelohanellus kitauei]|uniref:Uncharacterized protein n=1 Tax=Thelohanellus kitauei TaxID=669202 RepID=A0A0C2MQW8_THEKT|nr:hypothetical protein RF11_04852 [Thelohanellus kitauei]
MADHNQAGFFFKERMNFRLLKSTVKRWDYNHIYQQVILYVSRNQKAWTRLEAPTPRSSDVNEKLLYYYLRDWNINQFIVNGLRFSNGEAETRSTTEVVFNTLQLYSLKSGCFEPEMSGTILQNTFEEAITISTSRLYEENMNNIAIYSAFCTKR